MEKRIIEFSDQMRSADSYPIQFVQRIRKAENRGLKLQPGQRITEEMLQEFETRGIYKVGTTTPVIGSTLTEADRRRIKANINESYERHLRDDERRKQLKEKIELEQKLRPFHASIIETKKDNYIF